ncbi:hypothetical protein PR003_g25458 [Phytophthora rubi]|uniref:Uncharacterized protein n=1 Tax=Phytophthora rubi TaxID=129364 RepID=A0A6A3IHF1_9STRA|nr:hypothetical protein PR002_g28008 [Phytophthora rubi]KAE8979918.1 hypothetical protein PR001_g24417 [Phytophthora rubi]KAE9289789.1 hypothetical protein PR003_g25458 [Phytophthora rubi]
MSDPEGSASTVPPSALAPSPAAPPVTYSSTATSTVASAASASILGAPTPLSGSSGLPPAPSLTAVASGVTSSPADAPAISPVASIGAPAASLALTFPSSSPSSPASGVVLLPAVALVGPSVASVVAPATPFATVHLSAASGSLPAPASSSTTSPVVPSPTAAPVVQSVASTAVTASLDLDTPVTSLAIAPYCRDCAAGLLPIPVPPVVHASAGGGAPLGTLLRSRMLQELAAENYALATASETSTARASALVDHATQLHAELAQARASLDALHDTVRQFRSAPKPPAINRLLRGSKREGFY